jgi:hypothetical protein
MNTLECNPPMDNYHWSNITHEAKDLIVSLVAEREKRISIQ